MKVCSKERTESRIFKHSLKARFIEDKRRKTHKKNFSKKYPRLALYLFCSPSITSGKNFWKFAVTHYILKQVPSRRTKYLKSKCSLLILAFLLENGGFKVQQCMTGIKREKIR